MSYSDFRRVISEITGISIEELEKKTFSRMEARNLLREVGSKTKALMSVTLLKNGMTLQELFEKIMFW